MACYMRGPHHKINFRCELRKLIQSLTCSKSAQQLTAHCCHHDTTQLDRTHTEIIYDILKTESRIDFATVCGAIFILLGIYYSQFV